MIDVLIGLVALMALGVAFCFIAAAKAPVGYEDERGFHLGPNTEVSGDFEGAVPHMHS